MRFTKYLKIISISMILFFVFLILFSFVSCVKESRSYPKNYNMSAWDDQNYFNVNFEKSK